MLIVLCGLFGNRVHGHNGSLAVAYPVSGITIDGQLDDWPVNSLVYHAQFPDYGDKPDDSMDLSSRFWVGHNVSERALYVAVEVIDDSAVIDPNAGTAWDTQDGCSIYLDRVHSPSISVLEQHFQCGEKLTAVGYGTEKMIVSVKVSRSSNKRVYEWRIPLGDAYEMERSLGFDIDVTDKDDDGSFTWLAWGKGTQKAYNPLSIGDLYLLPEGTELGAASGSLGWSGENQDDPLPNVSLQSINNPRLRVEVACDQAAQYEVRLPACGYIVSAVGGQGQRVNESTHIHVQVGPNETVNSGRLLVSRLEKPSMIKEKGMLQGEAIDRDRIDRFVRAYMDYYKIPGISLAVVADSQIAYHQEYGVENAVSQKPLTEESVLEACSLTKPVFAFAVNRLIERGVLELDRPLASYLPQPEGYEDVLEDERWKRITAKHVLTHRTGFPNWRGTNRLSIGFEPGTKYGYSGEGFHLLSAVVAHLTKKSLVDIVEQEVFDPLGMKNAYLVWNDTLAARVGNGHTGGMSPLRKSKSLYPGMAYSLHINGVNYAKLMTAIIRREGLQADTYSKMLSRQFDIVDSQNPYEYPYGLGLVVEETALGKRFWHSGVNPGWRCQFAIYDELKAGYVVFTNNEQGQEFAADLERFLITGNK